MTISHRRIIIFAGVLLAVATGMQLVPKEYAPYWVPPKPLHDIVPAAVTGWEVEDRKLGDTELVRDEVKKILRYEDAFFRTYRRGNTEVGVYVAYWKPSMIDPTDAATHSPDLCWINAGWREESHDYEAKLDDGAGRPLKIAQLRDFSMSGGAHQEVVFWHFIGGRLSGYALGPSTRWRTRLPVLWENQVHNWFGFRQREQFFIRISTNRSIEELKAGPLWRELIRGLAPTGLHEEDAK